MAQTVTVGLVQMQCSEDPDVNLNKAIAGIHETTQKGADVVCLSELFRRPYFCQTKDKKYFEWAESVPGPTTQALSQAAKETKSTVIGSVFEKVSDTEYRNTAVVFGPNGIMMGKYWKMHMPHDDVNGYNETFFFKPGQLNEIGFQVFETPKAKISPLICWDQWFPEAARICAVKGAQILFYPTAIGWPLRERENKEKLNRLEHDMWITTQRSHGIDNRVFVVAVNRVGVEGGINFWGTSFVSSPYGEILARGPTDREENIVVECDLSISEKMKADCWDVIEDRVLRIEELIKK